MSRLRSWRKKQGSNHSVKHGSFIELDVITASNMKAVARTILMPSQSLMKLLCYPEAYKFSTKATRYKTTFGIYLIYTYYLLSMHAGGVAHMKNLQYKLIKRLLQNVMKHLRSHTSWFSFGHRAAISCGFTR